MAEKHEPWRPRLEIYATSQSTRIRASSPTTRSSNCSPTSCSATRTSRRRIFTFTLREGHRWSDGTPFTTEDFRYYWEDIALNKELSPTGPPEVMIVEGKLPKVEILDELKVRYRGTRPNPRFLPALAQPRALTLFSPGTTSSSSTASTATRASLTSLRQRRS